MTKHDILVALLCLFCGHNVWAQSVLISEYVDGEGDNNSVELTNIGPMPLLLSDYHIEIQHNGGLMQDRIALPDFMLRPRASFVISHASANAIMREYADFMTPLLSFDGDDVVLVKQQAAIVDGIGQIGVQPVGGWSNNGVGTRLQTLIRLPEICSGYIDLENAYDPSEQWQSRAVGDVRNLGRHTFQCPVEEVDFIGTIQGDDFISPLIGREISVRGYVTGRYEDVYFIQDLGDGLISTSDAIAVAGELPLNRWVTLRGSVQEYDHYLGRDCDASVLTNCETRLVNTEILEILDDEAAPEFVGWNPPASIVAGKIYKEMLEGMRVSIPASAIVTGPTNYGQFHVVELPNEFVPNGILPVEFGGFAVGVRHWRELGRTGPNRGDYPENLLVGARVSQVRGVLGSYYGDYVIFTQGDNTWLRETWEPEPNPTPLAPQATPNQITIGSFNAENFISVMDQNKIDKVTNTIVQMGCPSILALQEVGLMNTGESDVVIGALMENLTLHGCEGYSQQYGWSHPDAGNKGNALLWQESDKVQQVSVHANWQACSEVGSSSAEAYDQFCPGDDYPLFSRRPVVWKGRILPTYNFLLDGADPEPLTVGKTIAVINVHLKSQIGADADQRRLEQARFLTEQLEVLSEEVDGIVLLGDFNDTPISQPLIQIQNSAFLTNLWEQSVLSHQFSYNYNGVSQALDHIFVDDRLIRIGGVQFYPLHLNSVIPYYRERPAANRVGPSNRAYQDIGEIPFGASDHDPIVMSFGDTDLTDEFQHQVNSCLAIFVALQARTFESSKSTKMRPRKLANVMMPELEGLYRLRDKHLAHTIEGKEIIDGYYGLSKEAISLAITKDPDMVFIMSDLLAGFMDSINRFIVDKPFDERDIVHSEDLLKIEQVTNFFYENGSFELKAFIQKFYIDKINMWEYKGKPKQRFIMDYIKNLR